MLTERAPFVLEPIMWAKSDELTGCMTPFACILMDVDGAQSNPSTYFSAFSSGRPANAAHLKMWLKGLQARDVGVAVEQLKGPIYGDYVKIEKLPAGATLVKVESGSSSSKAPRLVLVVNRDLSENKKTNLFEHKEVPTVCWLPTLPLPQSQPQPLPQPQPHSRATAAATATAAVRQCFFFRHAVTASGGAVEAPHTDEYSAKRAHAVPTLAKLGVWTVNLRLFERVESVKMRFS